MQPPNAVETVVPLDPVALDLITGDAVEPLDSQRDRGDRYILVRAGSMRCDFRPEGEELGYLAARLGELSLYSHAAENRLGPAAGRRWVAVAWGTRDT